MTERKYNFAEGWPIVMSALHEAVFGVYGEKVPDNPFDKIAYHKALEKEGLVMIYSERSGTYILYCQGGAALTVKRSFTPTIGILSEDGMVKRAKEALERFTESKLVEVT